MKKLVSIFCILFSSYSFAENSAENNQFTCKEIEEVAGLAQTLRQVGMKPSEATDKLLELPNKVAKDMIKQGIDETSSKERIKQVTDISEKYKNALSNYIIISILQAFEVPIEPNKEMKEKAVEKFSNEAYLACLFSVSEKEYENK